MKSIFTSALATAVVYGTQETEGATNLFQIVVVDEAGEAQQFSEEDYEKNFGSAMEEQFGPWYDMLHRYEEEFNESGLIQTDDNGGLLLAESNPVNYEDFKAWFISQNSEAEVPEDGSQAAADYIEGLASGSLLLQAGQDFANEEQFKEWFTSHFEKTEPQDAKDLAEVYFTENDGGELLLIEQNFETQDQFQGWIKDQFVKPETKDGQEMAYTYIDEQDSMGITTAIAPTPEDLQGDSALNLSGIAESKIGETFAMMGENPFMAAYLDATSSDLQFEEVAAQLRNPSNFNPDHSSDNFESFVNQLIAGTNETDQTNQTDQTNHTENALNLRHRRYTPTNLKHGSNTKKPTNLQGTHYHKSQFEHHLESVMPLNLQDMNETEFKDWWANETDVATEFATERAKQNLDHFLNTTDALNGTVVGDVLRAVLDNSSISLAGKMIGKTSKMVHSADIKIYGTLAVVAVLALLGICMHNTLKTKKEEKQVSDDFEALI